MSESTPTLYELWTAYEAASVATNVPWLQNVTYHEAIEALTSLRDLLGQSPEAEALTVMLRQIEAWAAPVTAAYEAADAARRAARQAWQQAKQAGIAR